MIKEREKLKKSKDRRRSDKNEKTNMCICD